MSSSNMTKKEMKAYVKMRIFTIEYLIESYKEKIKTKPTLAISNEFYDLLKRNFGKEKMSAVERKKFNKNLAKLIKIDVKKIVISKGDIHTEDINLYYEFALY